MEIGLCALPGYGDLVSAKGFCFVMERLGDVAQEMDNELQGLLSVSGRESVVVYPLGLYFNASGQPMMDCKEV